MGGQQDLGDAILFRERYLRLESHIILSPNVDNAGSSVRGLPACECR